MRLNVYAEEITDRIRIRVLLDALDALDRHYLDSFRVQLLSHAVGWPHLNRNYYTTSPTKHSFDEWEALVRIGYAQRGRTINDPPNELVVFHVTNDGVAALRRILEASQRDERKGLEVYLATDVVGDREGGAVSRERIIASILRELGNLACEAWPSADLYLHDQRVPAVAIPRAALRRLIKLYDEVRADDGD